MSRYNDGRYAAKAWAGRILAAAVIVALIVLVYLAWFRPR